LGVLLRAPPRQAGEPRWDKLWSLCLPVVRSTGGRDKRGPPRHTSEARLPPIVALSSRSFALALDLLGYLPDATITQPAMPLSRVIAISHFELLQKPYQVHRAQLSGQCLQAR
jgi:hypothetical protein